MLKLDPYGLTDVGRRRDHNEDFLGDLIFRDGRKFGPELLNERGYLFAVADGMGGHASGEVASEMAITVLFDRYYTGTGGGNIESNLFGAVREANFQVHQAGISGGRGQMGTTLTLALIVGNRAVVGNVGDSRTYLIRQGLTQRVTHDHSLVQDQIDMGVLTQEEAEHSSVRNVITRAMGNRNDVDPDFFEEELQVHDILLLCSDGLHGLVREEEIGPLVGGAASLKEAARNLVDLANERGGPDNISVLLIGIIELGDPIPPILKKASFYPPPPRNSANEKTEPFKDPKTDKIKLTNLTGIELQVGTALAEPGSPASPNSIADSGSSGEKSTEKFSVNPGVGTIKSEEATSPAIPLTQRSIPVKGRSVWRFLLPVVILLAIAGGAAYYFLSASPTPAPIAAPTITAAPANTLPTVPPTNPPPASTPSQPAPSALPTVTTGGTPGANSSPNLSAAIAVLTPNSKLAIELDKIKDIQLVLPGFATAGYEVTMKQSFGNLDLKFLPVSGTPSTVETSVSPLSAGTYIITIQSPRGSPPVTPNEITLTLSKTEAISNDQNKISLSKLTESTLVINLISK